METSTLEPPRSPEIGEELPIQVLLRLKPLDGQHQSIVMHAGPRSLKICNPVQTTSTNGDSIMVSKRLEYTFDWVLSDSSSQEDTFKKSCPSMMRHFLSGGNALLFCFGPSGSGKSFTILGDEKNPGILPNIISSVFASIEKMKEKNSTSKPKKPQNSKFQGWEPMVFPLLDDMEYNVWISYLECYNEKIYDLLKQEKGKKTDPNQHQPLDIKYNKNNVPVIPSNEPHVSDRKQAMQWMQIGNLNRQTGATSINKLSSRSHAIFTIKLTQTPIGATTDDIKANPSIVKYSKFCIVDLAGCERGDKSMAVGERLKEAAHINNSLLTLKRCMKILQQNQMIANGTWVPPTPEPSNPSQDKRLSSNSNNGNKRMSSQNAQPKQEVVPFRDSTLTKLLREYFQREGKCCVIVNICPSPTEYEESLHALEFGTITKAVKTTTCKKKVVTRSTSPPQPIPFSLTQDRATKPQTSSNPTSSTSNSLLRQASKKENISALNSKASSSKLSSSQTLEKSSELALSSSLHIKKLAQSHDNIENRINPNSDREGHNNIAQGRSVEVIYSPSQSVLNRSRLSISSSTTTVPPISTYATGVGHGTSSSLQQKHLNFDDCMMNPPGTIETSNSLMDDQIENEGDFEDSRDDLDEDSKELLNENEQLRKNLFEAICNNTKIEMQVRYEAAQEMADRISQLTSDYKQQSEQAVSNCEIKYKKLLLFNQQRSEQELQELQNVIDSQNIELDELFAESSNKSDQIEVLKSEIDNWKEKESQWTKTVSILESTLSQYEKEIEQLKKSPPQVQQVQHEKMEINSTVLQTEPEEIEEQPKPAVKRRGRATLKEKAAAAAVTAVEPEPIREVVPVEGEESFVPVEELIAPMPSESQESATIEIPEGNRGRNAKKRKGRADWGPLIEAAGILKVPKTSSDSVPVRDVKIETAIAIAEYPNPQLQQPPQAVAEAPIEHSAPMESADSESPKKETATKPSRSKSRYQNVASNKRVIVEDDREEPVEQPNEEVDATTAEEKPKKRGGRKAKTPTLVSTTSSSSKEIEKSVVMQSPLPHTLAAKGRLLASPSSPHLIASPPAKLKRFGIGDGSSDENSSNLTVESASSTTITSAKSIRTPLTKRLRTRKQEAMKVNPFDFDRHCEEESQKESKKKKKESTTSSRTSHKPAPKYLFNFFDS